MPPMPYVVTQGYINTALENAFNFGYPKDGLARTPAQTKLDTLNDLRLGLPVGRCGNFLSDVVADHIDQHWFGKDLANPGNPPDPNQPTGWWVNWSGPAEEIARKGMITALEVALGLNPDEESADAALTPADHLMDFSWVCPVGRFEIWVGWRDITDLFADRDSLAMVTVTMATPGYGEFPNPHNPAIPEFQELKTELTPERFPDPYPPNGHIVIGAAKTTPRKQEYLLRGGLFGEDNRWRLVLSTGTSASGKVVVHAPIPNDGINAEGYPGQGVVK